MAKQKTIFIADDHPLMLSGLQAVIEKYPQFEVVGTAQNGADALSAIAKSNPDIALLDIDMPFLTGLEVIKKCQAAKLKTKYVLLTFHKEESLYKEAKQLGIHGYVLKDQSLQEIIQCLHHVANDEMYVSRKLKELLQKDETSTIIESLTKTELAVLKLIARDKTSLEISQMLFVSIKTVETHRSNICKKLELDGSKNSLLSWALKYRNAIL